MSTSLPCVDLVIDGAGAVVADQYSAKKKTVGELLSTTGPNIVVPAWQRSYSWDAGQAESFWTDLLEFDGSYPGDRVNDQEYFLGTIVIVDSERDQLLLDGQQRLATSTILLSAIRDTLAQYSKDAATRTSQKYISDFDDATNSNTYKLTLNQYDTDFFRREVQEYQPGSAAPEANQRSHGLIRKVRELFVARLAEMWVEHGGARAAFERILRLRSVLVDHVSLVAVTSIDEDNAASVFETLNDRGIGLSTTDLLRNFLMQRAHKNERQELIDCWRTVLEVAEDARVQEFLRHYWLSHRGDVKNRSLYREIKATFIAEQMSSIVFSRDLEASASIYRDIAAARDDDPEITRLLRGVSQLGASVLMPALLSAYAVGKTDDKIAFLEAVTAFFVRHRIVAGLENNRLEAVVFGVAKRLRDSGEFDRAIATLRANVPGDEQFVRKFVDISVTRRDTVRYLLSMLEVHSQETGEQAVELPDRVHIEHIYPQKPQADNRWSNHAAMINRLGNQTLLSRRINQSISNSPFLQKRDRYLDSRLVMTNAVAKLSDWTPEQISVRQQAMAEMAPTVWAIPVDDATPWEL